MSPRRPILSVPEYPAGFRTQTEKLPSFLAARIPAISRTELILVLILLFTSSASAATSTKGVNANGDNLFWIILTVVLTLLFALRGMMKLFITNPLMPLILVVMIVVLYIIFTALNIVYGIGDWIDNSVQSTVNVITSMRGT